MNYEEYLQERIDAIAQEMYGVNYHDIAWAGQQLEVCDRLKKELQGSDDDLLRVAATLGL